MSQRKSKSSPYEYDEYFYRNENDNLIKKSINSLIETFSVVSGSDEKSELYLKKYKDRLYCPECKKALLNFKYNSKTPYLSKNSNSDHKGDCSHNHPSSTNKEAKEALRNMSPEDKQRRLGSVVSSLIKEDDKATPKADNDNNSEEKENPYVFDEKGNKSSQRRLRTKSINRILALSEEGIYLVYGQANFLLEENKYKKSKVKYRLKASTTKENKPVIDIAITELPLKYLCKTSSFFKQLKNDSKGTCYFAAFLDIRIEKGTHKIFYNSLLRTSADIYFSNPIVLA